MTIYSYSRLCFIILRRTKKNNGLSLWRKSFIIFLLISSVWDLGRGQEEHPMSISGIYPHLAYYNQGGECGTGAVVPWAGKLWVITYSPHFPMGSSDKLYEISEDLEIVTREESIGGTPANRMIHRESNQLFIGPHVIDDQGRVRTIPYDAMMGRHTGNARHLFDPASKIYYATMEEGFYEVDVESLDVTMLYRDANRNGMPDDHKPTDVNPESATLPGAHGKGLYSGQGVMVYSNNGEASEEALKRFDIESGVLSEWNGEKWEVIRRNQFVEVTGPGGIYGNPYPALDPIWVTGWDHRSLLVGVRNSQEWAFYRLPKASHSYDGAHGWNTEWPRIRNVGTAAQPDYLMTMHGMFWHFPKSFTAHHSAGVRPRSAYLKVIGDFTRWNDQLVFGCDDSAQKEFLNKRNQKGGIEGPGQSNSNLWFTSFDTPDHLGPTTAHGAVWMDEEIAADTYSEPFLFAGWPRRSAWLYNQGASAVTFTTEVDEKGKGEWTESANHLVQPGQAILIGFSAEQKGEWIRLKTSGSTRATVSFNYSDLDERNTEADQMFSGLVHCQKLDAWSGLLYGLGDDRRTLGVAVSHFKDGEEQTIGYYELDEKLKLVRKQDPETLAFIKRKFAIPKNVISMESSSVLVIDDQDRRWRLPLGAGGFTSLTNQGHLRICREVATERDLFNCHGTFYELPAENADGFAKIRPIASHHFRIHDYTSYRGLLVMTGVEPRAHTNEHIIQSEDENAAVWVGTIDDLWKLGKPTGRGGPWKETEVKANQPSDPYLIGFYSRRSLTLSHQANTSVVFRLEVDATGHGPWLPYAEIAVAPGETYEYIFPDYFEARWIRFISHTTCRATAWLIYE